MVWQPDLGAKMGRSVTKGPCQLPPHGPAKAPSATSHEGASPNENEDDLRHDAPGDEEHHRPRLCTNSRNTIAAAPTTQT